MAKDEPLIGDPVYSRKRAEDCRELARQNGMECYASDLMALACDYERAALRIECTSEAGLEEGQRLLARHETILARRRHAIAQLDDGGEPTDIAEAVLGELEDELRAERTIIARAAETTARGQREDGMSDHVYKVIELVGSSAESIEDAIQNAINRASGSIRHIGWFEVISTRGHVANNKITHFQVTLKVGFSLEHSPE